MRKQMSLALVSAVLTAVSATAATSIDESFSYPAGAALGDGGTGFSGGWGAPVATGPGTVTAGASSLVAGSLATSGGSAILGATKNGSNDGNVSITRSLASPLVSNSGGSVTVQPYYVSFIAKADESLWTVQDAGQRQWGTGLTLILKDANGNSMTLGKAGGSIGWGLGTSGFAAGIAAVEMDTQPALIVMKFTPQPWSVTGLSFWVNPSEVGGAEPATTMTTSTNIGFTFSEIELSASISGWLPGVTTLNHQIDEIRVGDTWADVTAVPEPAATALLAGSLLLALRRRRA